MAILDIASLLTQEVSIDHAASRMFFITVINPLDCDQTGNKTC